MRSKSEEPDIGNDGKVDDGLKDARPCTDALHLIKGNGGEDTRRKDGKIFGRERSRGDKIKRKWRRKEGQ